MVWIALIEASSKISDGLLPRESKILKSPVHDTWKTPSNSPILSIRILSDYNLPLFFPSSTSMSTVVPESCNNCWFCDYHNISSDPICQRCRGLTIPTRNDQIRLEWTGEPFDALRFNKVQADCFFAWIKNLDGQERLAIKIGTGLRQADAHAQAVGDSLKHRGIRGEKKIARREYTKILFVKSPEIGKYFTISEPKLDEEGQLSRTMWDDGKGANQIFWATANQILDLDTHSPVRKVC